VRTYVTYDITLGVASSVANDVIMRTGTASADNSWRMEIWRLATCGHGLQRSSSIEILSAAIHRREKSHFKSLEYFELECGKMPSVMAAQPNIGGALCESSIIPFLVLRRTVWLTPAAGVPCSNAANIGER